MRGSVGSWVTVLALAVLSTGVWLGGALPVEAQGSGYTVTVTSDEDSAYLGVRLQEETEHPEGGARVTHIVDDSPASRAGIEVDDIIVRFDDEVIRGPKALTERIHARSPGDEVSVIVLRDGKQQDLQVELGDRSVAWGTRGLIPLNPSGNTYVYPAPGSDSWEAWQKELQQRMKELAERIGEQQSNRGQWNDALQQYGNRLRPYSFSFGDDKPKLGVQLSETTAELREHLGGNGDAGVLVSKVLAGTPAEIAGIEVGDLIVSVDGEPVASHGDLVSALGDKEGASFPVEVVRGGKSLTIRVSIPKPDEDPPTGPRA